MHRFSPTQLVGLAVLAFGLGAILSAPADLASLAAGVACIVGGLVPFHPTGEDEDGEAL